ncbi:hypothetical protein QCA50_012562 [Cerrena zonata]|uniref:Uncharacterized protein n=1 Tax=Cerrena zonata TaxID=2478898 RepID=A0AAW0FT63_9APHY
MLHYSLTPSEIDIIVGAYTGYDQQHKQISVYTWWPTPTVWDTSGLQVGYWIVNANHTQLGVPLLEDEAAHCHIVLWHMQFWTVSSENWKNACSSI